MKILRVEKAVKAWNKEQSVRQETEKLGKGQTPLSVPGVSLQNSVPTVTPRSVSAEPLSPRQPRAVRLRGYSPPRQDFAFPHGSVGRSLPAPPPAWRVPPKGSTTLRGITPSSAASLGAGTALAPQALVKGLSSLTPGIDPSPGITCPLSACLQGWGGRQRPKP